MEIQRNKTTKSPNSDSDTESDASQFESFHSYDSPTPTTLPPPPGLERWQRREEHEEVREERRRNRADVAVNVRRRSAREVILKRAELGFRVCEVVICLVSLLVMVSDKNKGWAGDSYYRYIEFRYCAAVNLIALIYSGLQACDLTIGSIRGNNFNFNRVRYQLNFAMDQMIAYLLISASSSGATRVDDWVSNWGKDEFTELADASIFVSFVAFFAFSASSLLSGYNLSCNL